MVDGTSSAPLLRVSRPVSACSRCRGAKVKCDGKLPSCTACVKAGKARECTGGSDQFARGKERSYISSLECRLEKLEKRLVELDTRQASVPCKSQFYRRLEAYPQLIPIRTATEIRSVDSKPSNAHEASTKSRAKRRVEADEMEELVADLGYMAINAVTRDFYGFTEQISYGRIALKASIVPGALDNKPRAQLPPRNTATQLVQHYFDKIFTTLPCLNESSFFGAVESVYRDRNAASQFDIFCVYMVLAVGTMSLSKTRDSTAAHNAACFVKSALEHADSVISPSEIKGVQATLLLVQYSMLEPAHFNSWYLIGVASRIMIDIGLHQEPLELSKRKPAEMDLRRRIFYCVYTLDRSISMVLQRPFTFSDDSVQVVLPRVEDTSLAQHLVTRGTLTPMAAAVHLFKLRQLQSNWYQTLHLCGNELLEDPASYVHEHTEKLARWREQIPETISQFTRDWLLLEWHYLNVYVAAPSPKIPRISAEAMTQIFGHCASYAIAFRAILNDSGNSRFVYTYHDALRTYFVGSNLLHTLYHAEGTLLPPTAQEKDLERASESIHAIVFVLSNMIIRWPDSEALRDKFHSEANYILAKLKRRLDRINAEKVQEQQERVLRNQMSFERWPTHNQQQLSPMSASGAQGIPFVMSGHVATPDFGNVAFYRYT
ncbi:fungal-specific transcription factor domain-containing protein [Geopyxis carbonaria]|nr:fungal-specific transcription factor domain-containing protein [Geopyxis carbonaria]